MIIVELLLVLEQRLHRLLPHFQVEYSNPNEKNDSEL